MITASAYAAATLNAPVEILSDPDKYGRVRVRTLAGGVGGWNEPGRELLVAPTMLHDITDTDGSIAAPAASTPAVPVAPLTAPIEAEDYMRLLLERQAAWQAAHPGARLAPLLEWFIAPGDEKWVRLPTAAPKRKPKPRVYRSAESIRAELAKVQAKMDRITGSGSEDNAIVNLSPFSRSRAARNAGRRRFAQLESDVERYAKLEARRDRLAWSLASAEAREAKQTAGAA